MKAGGTGRRNSTSRIFRWPIAFAIGSLVGLIAALIGDGGYDMLSWALLGGAAAAIAYFLLR